MSTGAITTPVHTSPRDQFLSVYEQEFQRTLRVLKAYPLDKEGLKPHPKSKSARELAWMFVMEQGGIEKALTTGFDFSQPQQFPPAPPLNETIKIFEETHKKIAGLVSGLRDDELYRPIRFFVGPGKIGDIPLMQVLWTFVHDQIHHRGQFSVYLRMADGRVPSIYGPSLDEPWS
jgi:uncharacterized damage-inducible protein DinB